MSRFSLLFSLVVLGIPSYGQLLNDQQFIQLTSFNDNWGGGLTEIHDDYRSFGAQISSQFKISEIALYSKLTLSGFTTKLDSNKTRIDEAALIIGTPIWKYRGYQFELAGGLTTIGNYGGEGVQNLLHESIDILNVELPYSSTTKFYGTLGGRLRGESPLTPTSSDRYLTFATDLQYYHTFNYLSDFDAKIGLALHGRYADHLMLVAGYSYQNSTSNYTRDIAAIRETGVYFGYQVQLGLAYYGLRFYPETSFSLGNLGVNLQLNSNRQTVEEIDLELELGTLMDSKGFYTRFLWSEPIPKSSPFKLDFVYQFWSLSRAALGSIYPDNHGHYQQFSFGAQYSPIRMNKGWQILPYVGSRLGYRTEEVYSGFVQRESISVASMHAILEGGLRLKLPGNFISKNCYYGFTVNYSLAYPLLSFDTIPADMYFDFAQGYQIFGFGAFAAIDL